jgi:outer membrane protein OmpA-like peptidoglycan-associated protein
VTTKSILGMGLSPALLIVALAAGGCATEEYVHQQVAPAHATANEALQRANAAHKLAEGKFLYETTFADDSLKFRSGQHELSPEAQARLSELAAKLRADNRDVYVEVQGFTDSTGSEARNMTLGEARAEAVRRYLHRQGVPLNRMATISYGEADPVASNATAEGRAQNRRVVVVVLA